MKIIKASEVKVGDTLKSSLHSESRSFLVKRLECYDNIISIYFDRDEHVFNCPLQPQEEIILEHRPWPEGKTENEMIQEVGEIATLLSVLMYHILGPRGSLEKLLPILSTDFTGFREVVQEARDAIDDYLMGLPKGD